MRVPLAKTSTRLMRHEGSGEPSCRVPVVLLLRTVKASFTDSGSMKSMPLVRGMRQTLLVVGVKVLSELG